MLSALLLTGCAEFQDVADKAAERTAAAVVAPYKAQLMQCVVLAQTEPQALECMALVREAWESVLGPGSIDTSPMTVVVEPIQEGE